MFWDNYDNKYAIELYNFRNGAGTANVTIHNDGCAYYWPQNAKNPSDSDYVLVKHVDSSGNAELEYKQLVVQMPDIDVSGMEGDITTIYEDIGWIYEYLDTLSSEISGHLGGDYWESGGNSSTCYGSDIGNSNGNSVINLDGQSFVGNWYSSGTFEAYGELISHNGVYSVDGYYFSGGCSYILDNYAMFAGSVQVGCSLDVGCAINVGCSYISSGGAHVEGDISIPSGCSLVIGGTSLTESQLTALLQLIS